MFSLTSGIPTYYNQLLHNTDKFLDHSKKFLAKSNTEQKMAMKNYKSVPSNATIKEERIKCGKSCLMCPHGPYYYASGKVTLESWRKNILELDLTKRGKNT